MAHFALMISQPLLIISNWSESALIKSGSSLPKPCTLWGSEGLLLPRGLLLLNLSFHCLGHSQSCPSASEDPDPKSTDPGDGDWHLLLPHIVLQSSQQQHLSLIRQAGNESRGPQRLV